MSDEGRNSEYCRLTEKSSIWSFVFENEPTPQSYKRTIGSSVGALWECLEGFVRPTHVNVYALDYPQHSPIAELAVESEIEPGHPDSERLAEEYQSLEGIAWSDIQEHFDTEQRFPYYVEIERAVVRIELASGTHWLNADSELFHEWPHNGAPTSETCLWAPPLRIYYSSFYKPKEHASLLAINTFTDIWFEDTEIGKTNRQHLADFLACLCERTQPTTTDTNIAHAGREPGLRDRGMTELLPEEFC